jgi:hypothetical protein
MLSDEAAAASPDASSAMWQASSACEWRRCLCGGDVFPPCMRHRRSSCATSRGEAPRAPSVAFCIVQGSVLPFGHAPCVCSNGHENRGRGRSVSAARKPRRTAMGLP